jgi:hypothetical protein
VAAAETNKASSSGIGASVTEWLSSLDHSSPSTKVPRGEKMIELMSAQWIAGKPSQD